MAKSKLVIQPGPYFYAAAKGALAARGETISDWAKSKGQTVTNLKTAMTGGANGPKSIELRREITEYVGEDMLRTLIEDRMRREGILR